MSHALQHSYKWLPISYGVVTPCSSHRMFPGGVPCTPLLRSVCLVLLSSGSVRTGTSLYRNNGMLNETLGAEVVITIDERVTQRGDGLREDDSCYKELAAVFITPNPATLFLFLVLPQSSSLLFVEARKECASQEIPKSPAIAPRVIDTTLSPCYDRMGSHANFHTRLALSLKKRKLSKKSNGIPLAQKRVYLMRRTSYHGTWLGSLMVLAFLFPNLDREQLCGVQSGEYKLSFSMSSPQWYALYWQGYIDRQTH